MNPFQPNQTINCKTTGASVPSLQEKSYEINRISPAGYLWLKDADHSAQEIGPYDPNRFETVQ